MLTRRFILVLAIFTAITAAAAIVAQYSHWSDTIRILEARPAFPGFAEQLQSVNRIRILRAEDHAGDSVSFLRQNDRWVMDSKDGYPALQETIREMLIGLSELDLVEAKTANPNRYDKLHLRDVTAPGSLAAQVIIEDGGGKSLLDALFGKPVPSLSGSTPSIYMRQAGDPQTWLATGELEIRGASREWLPVKLLTIQRERIERVIYSAQDSGPLEFTYNGKLKRFDIVDLPPDRKIKSRYKVLQTAMEAERLVFEDVRRADGLAADPALGGATWRTKDGLTIMLEFAPDPSGIQNATPFALITVETAADADETVREDAAGIVARTEGWAFTLGPRTMERLRTTLDDLTEVRGSG